MDDPKGRDSLSLLLARPAGPTLPPIVISSTAHLEQLSTAIGLTLTSDPSHKSTYDHLASALVSEFPSGCSCRPTDRVVFRSRDEFVRHRATMSVLHPNVHVEVLDCISSVNELQTRATVWLTCSLSGYSGGDMKARESVARLEWQRLKGNG